MTHEPVLLAQVLNFLCRKDENESAKKKIVDCTLGLGGYTGKILENFPEAHVYALDRDARAIELAEERLEPCKGRFTVWHTNFGGMREVLEGHSPFDAFVFDLGVSNMQLTRAERGFSFQEDGPLDMRMNPGGPEPTAAEVLRTLPEAELAEMFWLYGEERHSRRIAAGIEERRKRKDFVNTTGELVELIRKILPAPVQRKMGTHPARRVFQALRIYVNDELQELEAGLAAAASLAAPGGIAAVVSYHSLEDRIVKHTFRAWEKEEKKGIALTRHPILPEPEEVERNFKARSAKLRVFRFGAAPKRHRDFSSGQLTEEVNAGGGSNEQQI